MAPKKSASSGRAKVREIEHNKRLVPASAKRERVKPETLVSESYQDMEDTQVTEFDIPKGKGKKFSSVDHIENQIEKRTRKDEVLRCVHGYLIGRVNKKVAIKENLRSFSGLVYKGDISRETFVKKTDNWNVAKIRTVVQFFGVSSKGNREELVDRMIDYLEKPSQVEIQDVPIAKSKKRKAGSSPKRVTKKRKIAKDPNAPKRNKNAYMHYSAMKRAEVVKKNPNASIGEVAKLIGKKWAKASTADTKKAEQLAKADKARYEKEKKKYDAKKK